MVVYSHSFAAVTVICVLANEALDNHAGGYMGMQAVYQRSLLNMVRI